MNDEAETRTVEGHLGCSQARTRRAVACAMTASAAGMQINGVFRHPSIRAALGEGKLDFAPPPKGLAAQTAAVAGDGRRRPRCGRPAATS